MNHSKIKVLWLVALVLLSGSSVEAEPSSPFDEVGLFYLRNLAPGDYGGHPQNWAVVQDPRGFIYVGNSDGVLEFDGVSWRTIPVPNRSAVRSLAVDADGRIFVGAGAEMGYLAPDETGRLSYLSLVEQIPEEDRDFNDVEETHVLPDGVYFVSNRRLFRWRGEQIDVWRPDGAFGRSFTLQDTLYVTTGLGELFYLDQDRLSPAPGGDVFARLGLFEGISHGSGAFLAVTEAGGLIRCLVDPPTEEACSPFRPELEPLLTRLQAHCVTSLPGGILAIGTFRGGVVLLDRDGNLLRIVDESSGLRHNAVSAVHADMQGGLWLGLDDGLARVAVTTSLSHFDKTTGLPGAVIDVVRHKGSLYVTTTSGVSRLETASEGRAPRFVTLSGIEKECWSLLSTEEGLLATCLGGVYDLETGRRIWSFPGQHVLALLRSEHRPERMYLGLEDGLAMLVLEDGVWRDAGRFEDVQAAINSIAEDEQGHLWLGTWLAGVLRLDIGTGDGAGSGDGAPSLSQFGEVDGLPPGAIAPRTVAGQVRFLSGDKRGLFRRGPEARGFVPDTTFGLPGSGQILEVAEDDQGRVWTLTEEAAGVALPSTEGGYSLAPTILSRLPPSARPVEGVLIESGGPLWIGTSQGLVRLETASALAPPIDGPVRIRRVTAADGSSVYDGYGQTATTPSWPFSSNTLRFAFAASHYDAPEHTRYRIRLDGFDNEWSSWSHETAKDYTNLWEGPYTFQVQARDAYGRISREDAFTFRILPPWYRTWWAYGLYALVVGVVLRIWTLSHRAELRREHETAERERALNVRLREVDRFKDEFLAKTSHELRTPLYGIIGLAEAMYDAEDEIPVSFRDRLAVIIASGHRLQRLVGDILDVSKLRKDRLELVRKPLDLKAIVHRVCGLLRPLADGKSLALVNSVPEGLPAVDADEQRLEQILLNLVGNAIKFTDSGEVEVSAQHLEERIRVAVRDTGIGIAAELQERIFQVFEQADGSMERQLGGTGLGLAVSRRLVELHGGQLSVESRPGEGATFFFTLPRAEPGVEVASIAALPVPTVVSEDSSASGSVKITARPEVAQPEESSRTARILLVDDEPVNRLILRSQLESAGYEVREAADGFQALERLDGIDLVLLDVMMPRMSGFDVCRKLRERFPPTELPVIFVTAKGRPEDMAEGFEAGGSDYLVKPVRMNELLARIGVHLELQAGHRRPIGGSAEGVTGSPPG